MSLTSTPTPPRVVLRPVRSTASASTTKPFNHAHGLSWREGLPEEEQKQELERAEAEEQDRILLPAWLQSHLIPSLHLPSPVPVPVPMPVPMSHAKPRAIIRDYVDSEPGDPQQPRRKVDGDLDVPRSVNSSLSPSAAIAPRRISFAGLGPLSLSASMSISMSMSPMASLTLRPPVPAVLLVERGRAEDPGSAGVGVSASVPDSLATVVPARLQPLAINIDVNSDLHQGHVDQVQLSIDGLGSVEYPFLLRRRSSAPVPVPGAGERTAVPLTAVCTAAAATAAEAELTAAPPPKERQEPGEGGNEVENALEVQMVDEIDVELCVLCHREKSRGDVVMREFELFWAWELDPASGAAELPPEGAGGQAIQDADANADADARRGGRRDAVDKGSGHLGLWLVCRDTEECERVAKSERY